MEFLVGALVVLGLLAIVTRFVSRDGSGRIRLPRIVDDSIGMWALRRMTGRRVWERRADHSPSATPGLDPNEADAMRAALGAAAAADVADPPPTQLGVPPRREVVSGRNGPVRSGRRPMVASAAMVSRTPVLDMRRRQEARTKRSPRASRLATIGSIAAIVAVAAIALSFAAGSIVPPGPPTGSGARSTVAPTNSDAPGGPSASPSASSPTPSPSVDPGASAQANGRRDTSAPVARITGLTVAAIAASTERRLTVAWSFTEPQSGIRSQVLQRRTDSGSWITVRVPMASTRSASFKVSGGQRYSFRILASDGSANIGPDVARAIRI